MSLDSAAAGRLKDALATVVAIPVTPFDAAGDVDWDTHARLIRRLVDGGVTVVTPNGNTGEFYALTQDETRRATESAIKAAEGNAEVLVGVGLDTASAISAARHASDAGASMVMIHQPVHPYLSGDGWIAYHEAIAEAVPDTGVVLYVRDPRINGPLIARLGERCPNVIGVKYAVRDPVLFAAVARDTAPGRFAWLAGLAELTAPGLWPAGARGFTSGLVNVVPALPLSMLAALRQGDLRRGHGRMGRGPAVRGAAQRRRVGRQRQRGQGGAGPARPVPPGRAPAEQAAAGNRRSQVAAILASWGLEVVPEARQ